MTSSNIRKLDVRDMTHLANKEKSGRNKLLAFETPKPL